MKFPLGSGLFEFDQSQASPMPLGSGLYGQQLPPPNIQSGAPQQGGDRVMELFNNPMFQYGMNLLGASTSPNPWGTALNNTLAAQATSMRGKRDQRLADLEEQSLAQRAKLADMEHERGLRNIGVAERNAATGERNADLTGRELEARIPLFEAQAKNYSSQADMEAQKIELQRQEAQRQQQFLQQILPMLPGGALMAPQPQAPQMQPQGAPLPPKANVPVEWGAINKAYADSQPARDNDRVRVLQEELALEQRPEFRQSLEREIARATGGTPVKVAPQAQAPSGDAGLRMAQAGTLASLGGLKGGSQLVELGKMMQPQTATPGSFLRDPATGGMTQVPDPKGDAQVDLQRRGVQVQESQEQRAEKKATSERQAKLADLEAGWRGTDAALERLEKGATELQGHKGLDTIGGWSGFLGMHKLPGAGKDADVKLTTLKSKMVVGAMTELKKLSETGSTGFGQLSEKENERLETLEANLAAAQSEKQLKNAVKDIADFARESRVRHKEHFESLRKSQGGESSAAIPLSDFLKSKRGGGNANR